MNPAKFLREVRNESAKVSWPTRKEVVASTIMVMIMAALFSLFFFVVDWTIGFGLRNLFGFGG